MSDAIHDTPPGQWWLMYVRWTNGKRETIHTQLPALLTESDRWWVLACLPEPRKSVMPAQWRRSE